MADDSNNAETQPCFNRDESRWPLKYTWTPTPANAPPRKFWGHYYYRGPQGQPVQVLYSKTKAQSEVIARHFANEPVLGFDMEWPWDDHKRSRLQDKVALIQLASERKVGLFHIALHEGQTPEEILAPALKEIIESSSIMKAGVAVLNADFKRLKTHFKLEPKGAFELSHLHSLVTFGGTNPEKATTKLHALSMQVETHLGLPLWKGNVWTSDWSLPLNSSQTQYAATDAYAGFMLFHCLNAKRLAMDPAPPIPRHAETYLPFAMPKHLSIQLESVSEDGETKIITAMEFFGASTKISEVVKKETASIKEAETNDVNDTVDSVETITSNAKVETERTPKVEKRPRKSQAKAKATLQNSDSSTNMDGRAWACYGRLASHRKGLSISQGVPAFIIASNRVLEALARMRPSNEQELLLVPGVGKQKVGQYGSDWLEIIERSKTEVKPREDRNNNQDARDEEKCNDSPLMQEDRDQKRRKIVRVGQSKEIIFLPGEQPFPSLSTGLSFEFSATTIAEEPSVPARVEDLDDSGGETIANSDEDLISISDEDSDEESDDDSAFGPPMELPPTQVLKRKRNITFSSGSVGQRSLHQSIIPPMAPELTHISPAKMKVATQPILISDSDPAPLANPPPKPALVLSSTSKAPAQMPAKPLDFQRTILRKKLEAYGKSVVWAMNPKPIGPLLSEETLQCLITTLPQTIEEFRHVPGIQPLMRACEGINKDVWGTFEKWTRGAGLIRVR